MLFLNSSVLQSRLPGPQYPHMGLPPPCPQPRTLFQALTRNITGCWSPTSVGELTWQPSLGLSPSPEGCPTLRAGAALVPLAGVVGWAWAVRLCSAALWLSLKLPTPHPQGATSPCCPLVLIPLCSVAAAWLFPTGQDVKKKGQTPKITS